MLSLSKAGTQANKAGAGSYKRSGFVQIILHPTVPAALRKSNTHRPLYFAQQLLLVQGSFGDTATMYHKHTPTPAQRTRFAFNLSKAQQPESHGCSNAFGCCLYCLWHRCLTAALYELPAHCHAFYKRDTN